MTLTAPTTPTNITATAGSCGTRVINVSWNASSGATSYTLYRNGTQVNKSVHLSYSDKGLAAGGSYTYTVTATNSKGTSAAGGTTPAQTTVPGACAKVTILQQPSYTDIVGHLIIAQTPAPNQFGFVQWQKNPNTSDGSDIPVTWNMGDKTGFYPTGNLALYQLGMANTYGSTGAQAKGNTLGEYMNSADVSAHGTPEYKLGVWPQLNWAPSPGIYPFSSTKNAIVGNVLMQIPTAFSSGGGNSNAYVGGNIVFINPKTGTRLAFVPDIFSNSNGADGDPNKHTMHIDSQTNNIVAEVGMGTNNPWITLAADSATEQWHPWSGYKKFAYTLTYQEFATILAAASSVEQGVSLNPGDWELQSAHINSEIHYQTGRAELGLSMQNYTLTIITN